MKFLQREKEQPMSVIQQDVSKKKRKKDHAHSREGEISAFFTSVRPTLAEKDGNAAAVDRRPERERSTKSSGVMPTTEVSDKGPYLGFGTRGPRHESTSYVSWSDSVRDPNIAPGHPEQVPVVAKDDGHITKHQVTSITSGEDSTIFECPAPPAAERGTHVSSEQFKVSSVIVSGPHQRVSRSCSLPQHTSSPQRMNLVDRAAKTYMAEAIQSPFSMPPSVPVRANRETHHYRPTVETRRNISTLSQARAQGTPVRRHMIADQRNDAADVEPQTSSDLDAVIEECNYTFDKRRRVSGQQRRHTVQPEQTFERFAMENVGEPRSNIERLVRFSGLERPSRIVPNFPGTSIYEQQAQRQSSPLLSPRYEDGAAAYSRSGAADFGDGDDMLYSEGYWEEYPEEQASHAVDLEIVDYGTEGSIAAEEHVQRLASDNGVVARGFWRPNRLY